MDWLKIQLPSLYVRIPLADIAFIEAQGNYSKVWLAGGLSHTFTLQLHAFEEKLTGGENALFARVGRSLLVNKNFVSLIDLPSQELLLMNAKYKQEFVVKASREALKELRNAIENERAEK